MFKIYKDSELYKFVNHFLFDTRYFPGESYGYNFCNYTKDVIKSVVACVVAYGVVTYLTMFGIVPWILSVFFGYPYPWNEGMNILSIASMIVLVGLGACAAMVGAAGICILFDTRKPQQAWNYTIDKILDNSVGEFVTTSYKSWKEKYCPLVELMEKKEDVAT